ncbi:site-2 protease family protein [Picosynechococcus sp. PCC 8807]|uniref:site-2 protease family protein n=1 Tax=Picosynechococcus sp. PCC 8807 TaxID=195248 RepID=UPI0008107B98|nr:site-2 protease family protein [Picosynechococcus sp. PCC 8807]ANV89598.1 Zn-dependent protease [Picosynechococcus sp. PCC 8807]
MQKNWQVGSLFGIPLYLDRSWFVILVLITAVDANDVLGQGFVQSPLVAVGLGFAMALLLFGSVLLHELGHSLVAKSQGISVKSITLFLFGGVASIDRESQTPLAAFAVAIAGPLVSFTLFGLFWVLWQYAPLGGAGTFLVRDLARLNLVLALFNLIPGLPLDGGQMFKAIVWQWTGDRLKGIRYAAASGKLLGTVAIAFGLLAVLLVGELGGLWLALIGWFVLRNADAYERLSDLQNLLLTLTAETTMGREFRVVNAHLSLREFAEQYLVLSPHPTRPTYASSEGRYRGLIRPKSLHRLERSQWDQLELMAIAIPLDKIPSVTEQDNLATVICALETLEEPFITVLSPAGAVAGIIDRAQIVQAIAKEYNINLPAQELQRIRSERVYPNGFPLVEIAQQLQPSES